MLPYHLGPPVEPEVQAVLEAAMVVPQKPGGLGAGGAVDHAVTLPIRPVGEAYPGWTTQKRIPPREFCHWRKG